MKKVILTSLVALLALTVAAPAMAAESTNDIYLNRGQQLKELTTATVVYTDTGVDINITINEGPIQPTLHLLDIYANELNGRSYSVKDRMNLTFSSITNGFAIHIDGTSDKWTEKIQNKFAEGVGNLPARLTTKLSNFLANHGIN